MQKSRPRITLFVNEIAIGIALPPCSETVVIEFEAHGSLWTGCTHEST